MSDKSLASYLVDYECAASSWWLGWVGIGWMQNLAGSYIAWKVNRKLRALARQQRIRAQLRFKGYDI
jgi:hypothetical protein